jgi:AICAR transformylase/IMP cyclohydrolase PurH
MTTTNLDYIERLIEQIRTEIKDMEWRHNTEACRKDHAQVEHQIIAAVEEANRIEPTLVEEIADVKPLHDRIHAIVLSLRVARNNLERLERHAELALDLTRQVQHSVEEPYDDHEL